METIKSYLEGMFASLPSTPEVVKAKYELFQMMEDKYNELIADGKNDNEAVGIVISEFGNLDELADDLGIKDVKAEFEMNDCRMIVRDEADGFIATNRKKSLLLSFGIFLCIICVCFPIIGELAFKNDVFAIGGMFLSIAIGVVCIVMGNVSVNPFRYIFEEATRLDYATNKYVMAERERSLTGHTLRLTIGIIICVLCWLPAALSEELSAAEMIIEGLAPALLFVLVGIGVFLIVQTNVEYGAYDKLLALNGEGKIKKSDNRDVPDYDNKVVDVVMHIYWPTITCIYLVWSFLTFAWFMTWIIWPVASVIFGALKVCFRDREQG